MSEPTFADLHRARLPLLLPNAWDAGSALVLARAGYAAVGTTSMGLAAAAGLPDGRRLSRDATAHLARALEGLPVHVSVDLEDGYDDDPDAVAAYVAELPVAGLNIEDSSADRLIDPGLAAAKVAAIKARRPDVFVNARVDTYWLGQDATEDVTLERAARYVAAGADGIFVPGVTDLEVVRRLAAAIPLPLNVLAGTGASLADLAEVGVRRVSTGSLPYRAALRAAVAAVEAVGTGGPVPDAIGYDDLQDTLLGHDRRPD